jgi:hypothetical protein
VSSTRKVSAISGRLGTCASTSNPVLLANETIPTGATPALELPIGRPFCLHLDFSQALQFPVEVFVGGTSWAQPVGTAQSFVEADFVLPPTPTFEARVGNTPIEITVRTGAQSMAAVEPLAVVSPFTTRVNAPASGAGTTSSPAAPSYDFTAMGLSPSQRSVWQISGPHAVPTPGLVVPANVVVQGIDDAASFQANGGAVPVVTLGAKTGLRDLAVVGAPDGAGSLAGACVVAAGVGATLGGVTSRRCDTGIRVEKSASLLVAGNGSTDLTEVAKGVVGANDASFTGIGFGLVGNGKVGAPGFSGFVGGTLSLVRPNLASVGSGIDVQGVATVDLIAPTIEATRAGLRFLEGATARVRGGLLTTSASMTGTASTTGVDVESGASFDGRGLHLVGGDSGLAVSGGTADITATVLTACGRSSASAVSASRAALAAHGLRIEQPEQLGVWATSDNQSLSLTNTVIESTTFRGIWIFGGTATLRNVAILDPQQTGLAYGDPAGALIASDLDIVRHEPSTGIGSLVFADRATTALADADAISFHTLRAGAGSVVSSIPGAPVCTLGLTDPVGGKYLSVNGNSVAMCY